MSSSRLPIRAIIGLLILSLIWGINWALVKLAVRDFAPLFMCGVRSLVAGFCLYIWMRLKGERIFPSRLAAFHGFILAVGFTIEFALIYVSLKYTLAAHVYVLLYTAPFPAAIGAHFFLSGDRLNTWKAAGLILAFCGVVVLFYRGLGAMTSLTWMGDLMALVAGVAWGACTIYLKKFLVHISTALQSSFYQVFFSGPLLLILSLLIEDPLIYGISGLGLFSMFYQCIIVAFLSYLAWFEMVKRYPASLLHAFSFFTPCFGVLLSGVFILHEPVTAGVVIALIMVSLGMVLVNRPR